MFSIGLSPLPNSWAAYMFEKYMSLRDLIYGHRLRTWWAYVIVTPLDNNITVFNKGNSKGLIGSIPIGGH